MRMAMVSALFAFTSFLCSPRPSAAQCNPIGSRPPQSSLSKPPSHNGAAVLPKASEVVGVPLLSDSANQSASTTARQAPMLFTFQKDGPRALDLHQEPDASNCAHIVIYPAPIMDSEMIVQSDPKEFGGSMPVFQALPPCSRDFRSPTLALRVFPKIPRPGPGIPFEKPALGQPAADPSSTPTPSLQPLSAPPNSKPAAPKSLRP